MSDQQTAPTSYTGPDGSIIQLITWERDGVIWGLHYDTIAVGDQLLYDYWDGERASEVPIVVTSLDHPFNAHRANGKVVSGAGLAGQRVFKIVHLRRPDGVNPTALIGANEAAQILGKSPQTVRHYHKQGYLTVAKRLGPTQYLYRRDEVERLRDNPPQRTGRPKQSPQ